MSRTARITIAALAMVLGAAGAVAAQEATVDSTFIWKRALAVDLTATQTAYSDSWTGGEAGAFSWVGNAAGFAERNLNPWFNLRSQVKLSFGQTTTQHEETKDWSKPKKSTDLIDWETVGRFLLNQYVDPYAAFRLESQFYDGSNAKKKLYLSPLKLTESAGLAHRFYEKSNDHITTRLGGAYRQIITRFIADTVTLATDSRTVSDAGLESVTDAVLTLSEKMQYTGKLTLFKALYNSEDDALGADDDWKAVDVRWENAVTAQVSKIIAVSFLFDLRYDKEIVDKAQIKETLGLGFLFKLI